MHNVENNTKAYGFKSNYAIHDGSYGVWQKGKGDVDYFVPKGNAVYISKIIKRIDTGEIYLKLYFYNSFGEKIEREFARRNLTEQGILDLIAYGVNVLKSDSKILIATIMQQESESPCELRHEKLGFTYYNKERVFLAKKAINVSSKYQGKYKIGRTGQYSVWKQMVENEVLGHIPLEFMLSVGGSAVITDFLREKVQVENVLVSLVSDSSKGKSTAGLLMVSCGAMPSFAGDSFVFTLADTVNAIMASIPSSYPTLLDEASLIKYNPTSLLYNLSMGKEKQRLTKDLDKANGSYFNTAIAITSEKGVLSSADENSGLMVRVLEIENVTWTQSAQSADEIKSVTYQNYGWLVPKLADYLLNSILEEDVVSKYWQWHKWLVQCAEDKGAYNNLTERACKQYALVMLSAELIQEVMGIELHLDDIGNFILEHSPVGENNKVNIGHRALHYLMQFIVKNYSNFIVPEENYMPMKCLGKIVKKEKKLLNGTISKERLIVTEDTLKEILKEGKFPEMNVVLKHWKEDGYLQCEKDRRASTVCVLPGKPTRGYVICLPCAEGDSEIENDEERGLSHGAVLAEN